MPDTPELELLYGRGAERRTFVLSGRGPVSVGRGLDNRLVLADRSVSRHHAEIRPEDGRWVLHDLGSTNGVVVDGSRVQQAHLAPGGRLRVGNVEVEVRAATAAAPSTAEEDEEAELLNATIVRRLDQLPSGMLAALDPAAAVKREALEAAYGNRVFGYVVRLAGALLTTDSLDQVLRRVMAVAFEALPVDRGFIFLRREDAEDPGRTPRGTEVEETGTADTEDPELGTDDTGVGKTAASGRPGGDSADRAKPAENVRRDEPGREGPVRESPAGELVCELARTGSRVTHGPGAPGEAPEVPVSRTMLRAVMERGVALVTPEAAEDRRLEGAESVRLHGLRSALCAPLFSGRRIVGVLVLDTPSQAGSFTEQDLELATALANFAAVAIERIRFAERVEHERRLRSRLERYHSPSVIDDVLRGQEGGDGTITRLKRAEVTVLFADLVGFTPMAEGAEPEDVAELLGTYFSGAVEAIFEAGGTLDKFIGDCVMAFFGAPVPRPDHARRALEAAARIARGVEAWSAQRRAAGQPGVAVRIALNSGTVVVGEVGSEQRVDYTVLGNTVNVAARLQSQVARPGEVVLGAATRERLGDALPEGLALESLGDVELVGLTHRVAAWRLVSAAAMPGAE